MSSSKTGRTVFRDTEVQQPNTAATWSFSNSSRAFSANKGQFEAGSTTTASTGLLSKPPLAFSSSTIIRIVSLRVVSLMAMVPERECSTPILIGSWAMALEVVRPELAKNAIVMVSWVRCFQFIMLGLLGRSNGYHLCSSKKHANNGFFFFEHPYPLVLLAQIIF